MKKIIKSGFSILLAVCLIVTLMPALGAGGMTAYADRGLPPVITTQPASQTVSWGQPVTLTVAASGDELSYQWYSLSESGTENMLTDGDLCTGTKTATLQIKKADNALNGARFLCLVLNSKGTVKSDIATMKVTPGITTQPTSQSIKAGEKASFTVAAQGPGNLTYQWCQMIKVSSMPVASPYPMSDINQYSGTKTANLVITNATETMNGEVYRCVVTNENGNVSTTDVTLTVTAAAQGQFTVTFDANGYGTAPAPITGLKAGDKIPEQARLTAPGRRFLGWSKEAKYGDMWDFTKDTVTKDMTLYGCWYDNRLIWVGEGGTATFSNDGLTLNIVPDSSHRINTVMVAGKEVNPVPTSLTGLQAGQTVYVEFYSLGPSPVSDISARLYGYNDVRLFWDNEINEKVSGYNVYYKKSSETAYQLYQTLSAAEMHTDFADLASGTKYNFKVCAFAKDSGKTYEGKALTISKTTLKKVTKPTAAKYAAGKVRVKWTNIAGESGYQISKSTKKTGTNIVSTYATTKGTSKVIKATKGKTYYYKVRAYKVENGKKIYGPWSAVRTYTLK